MEFIVIGIVMFFAACLQGSIGIGLGMVAAPVIALLRPELLPTTIILLATIATLFALLRERSSIDWRLFGWAFTGRVPGILIGAAAVALLPSAYLSLLLSGTVLGGVIFSLNGWSPTARPLNLFVAGGLSGLFGTATSIGGPPMALVMRNLDPANTRATLSAFFAFGSLASLAALWAGGTVQEAHLVSALGLAPFMALGLISSSFLIRYLSREKLFLIATVASVLGAVLVILETGFNLFLA